MSNANISRPSYPQSISNITPYVTFFSSIKILFILENIDQTQKEYLYKRMIHRKQEEEFVWIRRSSSVAIT